MNGLYFQRIENPDILIMAIYIFYLITHSFDVTPYIYEILKNFKKKQN